MKPVFFTLGVTAVLLLASLSACGPNRADDSNSMRQEAHGLSDKDKTQLAQQIHNDSLSLLHEINEVNRDLLLERLAELREMLESEEAQLNKLLTGNKTQVQSRIAGQNKTLQRLREQIREIENEVK